jgi:hypothetical protein
MACDGAGGDGRTAPGANAAEETVGVPILPGFLLLVGDDDIGSLNEGKSRVIIGFFRKVAVVGLPAGKRRPWGWCRNRRQRNPNG